MEAAQFPERLLFLQVFCGNIVLRDLMGVHFPFVSVVGVFCTYHGVGLKRVPFLDQLSYAFRVGLFNSGQSL